MFLESDSITMITWPLTVCVMLLTLVPTLYVDQWETCASNEKCKHMDVAGGSQKWFTAMSARIPFVLMPLTFSEFFLPLQNFVYMS